MGIVCVQVAVLVNNAGVGLYGPFQQGAVSEALSVLQVNSSSLPLHSSLFFPFPPSSLPLCLCLSVSLKVNVQAAVLLTRMLLPAMIREADSDGPQNQNGWWFGALPYVGRGWMNITICMYVWAYSLYRIVCTSLFVYVSGSFLAILAAAEARPAAHIVC